jgi:hypothetical protein
LYTIKLTLSSIITNNFSFNTTTSVAAKLYLKNFLTLFSGHQDYFLVVKKPRREVGHSLPFNAEVKNEKNYTSASLYDCMV